MTRGGGYALAAAKALPGATQVADRWHLMENASRAFLDAVRKSMRHIRASIGAATINPGLLTAAERIQYEGYLRREEENAAILGLAKDGATIREIVRRTGHSRGLVRRILRGQRSDVFRSREARWSCICPGWMHDGPRASATARHSGGSSRSKDFAAPCAWSQNGLRDGVEQSGPTPG